MAERDVVVRLKVRPENGKAFEEMSRRAKETEESVKRIGVASVAGGGGGQLLPGRTGGGSNGIGSSLALLGSFAGIAAIGQAAEGVKDGLVTFRDETKNATQKFRELAKSIPLVGQAGVSLGDAINEAFTGSRAGAAKELREGELQGRRGGLNEIALNAARSQRGIDREFSTMGLSEKAKLEKERAIALEDQAAAEKQIAAVLERKAANLDEKGQLKNLVFQNQLVQLEKSSTEDLIESKKRLLETEKGRIAIAERERAEQRAAGRQFELLGATEKLSALQAAKQAEAKGIGSLTADQKGLLGGVDVFKPLLQRETDKAAASDPLLKMANAIGLKAKAEVEVQVNLDAAELAKQMKNELGPVFKDLSVLVGKLGRTLAEAEGAQRGVDLRNKTINTTLAQ